MKRSYQPTGNAVMAILLLAAACRSPVSIDASALQVSAEVSPAEIVASRSLDGDSVRVIVTITNPAAYPVVVELGGPPYKSGNISAAQTSGIGFGVRLLGADGATHGGPSEWTWGQPTMTLGPRATLRHTFIIKVGGKTSSGLNAIPGNYRVLASFGRQEAAPVELRVLP